MGKINYYELATRFLDTYYGKNIKDGYSLVCWNGWLWYLVENDDKNVYFRMSKSQEAHLKVLVCGYLQNDQTNCPTENITSSMVNNTILNIKGLVLVVEENVITRFQGNQNLIRWVDATDKQEIMQKGAQYESK